MKKSIATLFCFFTVIVLLSSCGSQSPEKSFDIAVLNSNLLVGFANRGMTMELENPSAKMGKTKDEILPMNRNEVVDAKIKFVQENYDKLKSFSQDGDAKDMIQKSMALHEFILPVYNKEYRQLAKLYDGNAPKEEIEKYQASIHDQFYPKFESLYGELIASGKVYAKNHNIDVHWAN